MRLLMWSALRDELIVEGSPMESLHNRDSRLGLVFVLWWVGSLIWLEKIFSRGENLSDLLLSWTRCSPWYTLSFEYIWIWCDFLWRHFSLVSCPARWSLFSIDICTFVWSSDIFQTSDNREIYHWAQKVYQKTTNLQYMENCILELSTDSRFIVSLYTSRAHGI